MNNARYNILEELKSLGAKVTKTRKGLLGLLAAADHALSVPELLKELRKKSATVNKTTVYREVEFLLGRGVIRSVQLSSDRMSYELAAKGHHHHLVCRICTSVEEVDNEELEVVVQKLERFLSKTKKYRSVGHQLEFSGICEKCRA